MTVQASFPGVYVQESSRRCPDNNRRQHFSRTIFGTGADGGPTDKPVRCVSYTEFTKIFSDGDAGGDLARAGKLFFINGGTQCWIMRVANGATQSTDK